MKAAPSMAMAWKMGAFVHWRPIALLGTSMDTASQPVIEAAPITHVPSSPNSAIAAEWSGVTW